MAEGADLATRGDRRRRRCQLGGVVVARKQDIIEFESETEQPRVSIGGVVGAALGALIGYKLAQQTAFQPRPVPLPSMIIVNGESENGVDVVDFALKMGALAAVGYAIGAFFTKARSPRRFMLRHRD